MVNVCSTDEDMKETISYLCSSAFICGKNSLVRTQRHDRLGQLRGAQFPVPVAVETLNEARHVLARGGGNLLKLFEAQLPVAVAVEAAEHFLCLFQIIRGLALRRARRGGARRHRTAGRWPGEIL